MLKQLHLASASAFALSLLCLPSNCGAQESIPLWQEGAPGFEHRKNEPEEAESYWVKNVHNPTLTAFLPTEEKATGAAVVICPGGGHRLLVYNAEGVDAAKYFQEQGVAAFVLKYRLGREPNSPYDIEVHAKQDGQRAMRLVRSRAKEWNLDPNRIGIMGFSAGGEVASLVAYADHSPSQTPQDEIDKLSPAANFQILVYPGPVGIPGQLPESSPSTFMVVTNDDIGASKSILMLIPKFREAGIPFEAHIFARGGHAFNMGQRTKLHGLKRWSDRLTDWMIDNFILDPTGKEQFDDEWDKIKDRLKTP